MAGSGFSTPLAAADWTTTRIATAWVELMDQLGYDRFAVQGGDLGGAISPEVGRVAPDRVIGVHVNDRSGHFAALEEPDRLIDDIRRFLRPLREQPPPPSARPPESAG